MPMPIAVMGIVGREYSSTLAASRSHPPRLICSGLEFEKPGGQGLAFARALGKQLPELLDRLVGTAVPQHDLDRAAEGVFFHSVDDDFFRQKPNSGTRCIVRP